MIVNVCEWRIIEDASPIKRQNLVLIVIISTLSPTPVGFYLAWRLRRRDRAGRLANPKSELGTWSIQLSYQLCRNTFKRHNLAECLYAISFVDSGIGNRCIIAQVSELSDVSSWHRQYYGRYKARQTRMNGATSGFYPFLMACTIKGIMYYFVTKFTLGLVTVSELLSSSSLYYISTSKGRCGHFVHITRSGRKRPPSAAP